MTPADVEGRQFGPVPVAIDAGRIAAYVAATGDDPDRWVDTAPPGYAAAALFSVAPLFLFDPALMQWTRLLVHGDQQFTWHRPLEAGTYQMTGTVERVRMRQGTAFVAFAGVLDGPHGVALESSSTFLMGTEAPPPEEPTAEPDVDERGSNQAVGGGWVRSASRRDLVEYAAASGDFNPIHWDHERAVGAGLPGIVCHGLLMAAWANQAAMRAPQSTVELATARYRFKNPLRPAEQASLVVTSSEDSRIAVDMSTDGGTVMTAGLTIRT